MTYLTLLIVAANFIFSLFVVFVERKKPHEALTWLMVFSFLPVVGFVLYLFLGSTLSFRIDAQLRRKGAIDDEFTALLRREMPEALERGDISPEADEYHELVHMLHRAGRSAYTQDNHAELLADGQVFFPRLLEDIHSAQESIHIQFFIFEAREPIGKTVLEALAAKAKEGVEVRLIYDALGSLSTRPRHFHPLRRAGGRVKRHLPSMIASVFNANYLNHRKTVVIDGVIGYTGGINVGEAYLGRHKRCTPWRDTMVRLTGSAVADLQARFLKDWIFLEKRVHEKDPLKLHPKYFPPTLSEGNMGAQIVSSGPDTPNQPIKNGMVTMIYEAKRRVAVQSPYLIPDDTFMDALKNAAASGLRVDVMLPGIADKSYVYYVTKSNIEELLAAGVRVYLYQGFLHAKMMVIDGKVVTIGTTNVDIRSFALDFELNAFIYDTAFSEACMEQFDRDIEDCRELSYEEYRRRGGWGKLLESVYRLLSPIM